MAEQYYMKKACEHCPFRRDVKPFLTPERGEELAYHACNPYNTFPCHKTTVADDESDDGEMLVTNKSKECAGFMMLQINEGMEKPEGFDPDWSVAYADSWEMAGAYEEQKLVDED